MEKMKKYVKFILLVTVIAAVAVIALMSVDFEGERIIEAGDLRSDYDYGTFTFLREMSLSSGETAYYYESGDEDFSYFHDNEGYVLLRDEEKGILEYAANEQGKPVSSGVSYASSEEEIARVQKMSLGDVDLGLAGDNAVTNGLDGMSVVEAKPVLASASGADTVTNLTIFISFSGDKFSPSTELLNMFNGSSMSLKSYYQVMSNGTITISSQMPYDGNAVFVYQDSRSRNYYNTNGSNRWARESSLVTNAIVAARDYLSLPSGTDLDINDDGYIDSVSIIVYGSSSSTWGSLLWPHSVSLDAVDGDNNYTVINGKKVGNYSFNFSENITLGVLCHETAHVLGAPDLYHYNGSSSQNMDIVTVGKWDLMENDLSTPQYLLTYMRKNYIGGIGDNQILDITENGVYSLAPVSSATSTDEVLAYKIPTSKDEYFMLEYRRVTASGYDSLLPGSGLIIYRIKEPEDFSASSGNQNAVYQGTGNNADEVFVFRPSINMTGKETSDKTRYEHSAHDINQAYLSPNNSKFSKIGKETANGKYDLETIYFSDGSNSDIIIEALSISESSIEFSVRLGKDIVEDDYFDDKIELQSASVVNSTAFAGVSVNVAFGELSPQYLSALTIELRDANDSVLATNSLNQGRFLSEYNAGTRLIKSDFIYADKGNDITVGVFSYGSFLSDEAPVRAVLSITDADGDSKIIDEIDVSDSANIGWDTVVSSKTKLHAQVFASTKMTVGVKRDGTLDASGSFTTDQWAVEGYSGITSVALGYSHTLMLTQNLTVLAVGSDNYSETQVSDWYDVKAVAAGTYSSYGLKTDGTVVATGLNDKGQLDVDSWSGIKAISALSKRVVGLTLTGTVVAAGSFSSEELTLLSAVTGATQVEVGLNFVAVLKSDGSVQIIGNLSSADLSEFNGIAKLSAGINHLLGITEDGRVVATGDNSYGQSLVQGLYDIVDIAAGEYHSAFLREDGVVEFRGSGSTKYGTNVGVGNLLYSNYIPVSEIKGITNVSGGKVEVAKGSSTSIGVIHSPATATYARIIFASKDISVASIESTGYLTATIYGHSVGTTTATITDNGTGITMTITISVYEEKPLEGIAFSERARSILEGEKAYLTLNYIPEGATVTGEVSYTSSAPSVVSVTAVGLISALGSPGESAVITAKIGEFSASITVTIVGDVSAIEVDTLGASTLYRYGEELELSRYILKVTVGGSVESMVMTPDMISGYDKYDKTTVTQSVTVSYMGVSTTFSVSVKDYITRIEKVEEPTSRYLYNYDLEAVSGGYIVYYASGDEQGPNRFAAENFVGYDKTKVGMQYLTYTHVDSTWGTEFSLIQEVTVVDYAQGITFQPLKTTYFYGEELDKHEFVEINMMSGALRQLELAEFEVKDIHSPEEDESSPLYSLYSLRVGAHIVRVTYVDPETSEEKSTTATINVDISGEYMPEGRDEETSYYYYEVDKELYIGLTLVQSGADDVVVGSDKTQNIWFELFTMGEVETAFDNTVIGAQDSLIKVFVNRQSISGDTVSVSAVEVWSLSIEAYGLAKTTSVKIKDGARTEYNYGEAINGDKSNPDILIEITLEGGAVQEVAPMEISYDKTVIGTQTLMARYLDSWLPLEITVLDYVLSLSPIEDKTVLWGEEVELSVYAEFAYAGKTLLNSDEYAVSAYSNQSVGTQSITITYNADISINTSFSLTVLDAFKSITVSSAPRTKYAKGESFDPASTYTVTMISGATELVAYNDVDFYFTPVFNSETINQYQTISIYYRGEGVSTPKLVWSGSCYVPNYVLKLEIIASGTKTEYKYGEELSAMVRATYADGMVTTLDKKSYTSSFDGKLIGAQSVTITFVYNGVSYTVGINVNVSDSVTSLNITSLPSLISYGYGDVVNWTGAKVAVTYAAAGQIVYQGDEIKKLNVSYTTLIAGTQKVTVESGGVSEFFNISVGRESLAAEEVKSDNVTPSLSKRQIALKNPDSISAVVASFKTSSYLRATYKSVGAGEVNLSAEGSKGAATGDKLIFVNKEGVEVFVFSVYLNGDANGDGAVDSRDLEGMADMLAKGTAKSEVIDSNGDGKANLTDLVGYARKTGGGSPRSVPVSEAAKELIAPPIRLKGREEEQNA